MSWPSLQAVSRLRGDIGVRNVFDQISTRQPLLIGTNRTPYTHTGTLTEAVMQTVPFPAGIMRSSGVLLVDAWGYFTYGGTPSTYQIILHIGSTGTTADTSMGSIGWTSTVGVPTAWRAGWAVVATGLATQQSVPWGVTVASPTIMIPVSSSLTLDTTPSGATSTVGGWICSVAGDVGDVDDSIVCLNTAVTLLPPLDG